MNLQRRTKFRPSPYLALGVVFALSVTACGGAGGGSTVTGSSSTVASGGNQMGQPATATLTDTALVASNTGVAAKATTIDANLSNPWGLVTAPGLPFWVADNSNVATLYSGTGAVQTGKVTGSNDVGISIPASAAGLAANPTGQVYNGSGGFLIPTSGGNETALFILPARVARSLPGQRIAARRRSLFMMTEWSTEPVTRCTRVWPWAVSMAQPISTRPTCTTTRLTYSIPTLPSPPPCRENSSIRLCQLGSSPSASRR